MAVAIKNTGKRLIVRVLISEVFPDDVKLCARVAAQVNIRHQFETLVPVIGVGPDGIHLVCIVN